MVPAGNLENYKNQGLGWGVYREEQMPPISGGGERIISIVEMSKNTEVERGVHAEQMARDQRANSNKEDSDCQKCH